MDLLPYEKILENETLILKHILSTLHNLTMKSNMTNETQIDSIIVIIHLNFLKQLCEFLNH